MASNPFLADLYNSVAVIPHVRADSGPGREHVSRSPVVGFVGTPRDHKGLALLRQAVGELSDLGFSLVVTAPPPADPKPHEEWVGEVSLEKGIDIVKSSDVIALPSERKEFGALQLPAKLMDAMVAGRAIVASNLPPIAWALGDTGLLVEPKSHADLHEALKRLREPSLRRDLGHRARQRALAQFLPSANLESFRTAVHAALRAHSSGHSP